MSFRDEMRKRAGDILFGVGKGTTEPLIDQLQKVEEGAPEVEEGAPEVEEVAPEVKGALEARPPPKPRRGVAFVTS